MAIIIVPVVMSVKVGIVMVPVEMPLVVPMLANSEAIGGVEVPVLPLRTYFR